MEPPVEIEDDAAPAETQPDPDAIHGALLKAAGKTAPEVLDEQAVKDIWADKVLREKFFTKLRKLRTERRRDVAAYLEQNKPVRKAFKAWVKKRHLSAADGSSPAWGAHDMLLVLRKRKTGSWLSDEEKLKLKTSGKFKGKPVEPAVVEVALIAGIRPDAIYGGLIDDGPFPLSRTERTQIFKAVLASKIATIAAVTKDRSGCHYGAFRDALLDFAQKHDKGNLDKLTAALKQSKPSPR